MSRSARRGSSPRTNHARGSSTRRSARSPRAFAKSPSCLPPTCQRPRSACSRLWPRPASASSSSSRSSRSGPSGKPVIDSHTHLASCEPPDAELVAAALAAGVSRILTIGTDGSSCREALATAEAFPQVYAAIGRHPNSASGFDDADLAELQALAAHERCVAIGETGLDYFRNHAPRSDQERAFHAQIDLAREIEKTLVIHTRAAQDDT